MKYEQLENRLITGLNMIPPMWWEKYDTSLTEFIEVIMSEIKKKSCKKVHRKVYIECFETTRRIYVRMFDGETYIEVYTRAGFIYGNTVIGRYSVEEWEAFVNAELEGKSMVLDLV